MKSSKIWLIVILMSSALLGSSIIQIYWIRNTIQENERKFSLSVQEALVNVAQALDREEKSEISAQQNRGLISPRSYEQRFTLSGGNSLLRSDSLGLTHDWTKIAEINSNRRLLNNLALSERISLEKLSNYLSAALNNRGIQSDYNFAVYDNNQGCIVIRDGMYMACNDSDQSSKPDIEIEDSSYKYSANLFTSGYGSAGALMVDFPNESAEIWKSLLRSVLASLLFTLMILMCFGYTIYIIFRQKQVGQMKTDFINNMTHEFKTPIATISLATDSIKSKKVINDPDRIQRFVGIIKEENRRMLSQVEKVLQMALLDKKDFELKRSEVDMHDIVKQAAENVELTVIQREGELNTALEAQHSLINGDPTHLSNIVHNLLDNANKYSPEKPNILIRTKNKGDRFILEIQDHGIGLSRESQKHIFEKFYRVSTGNRHDVKGFGLGLSYVKAMVDAHQADVQVKSDLGKGSTFILSFPLFVKG